MRNKVKKILNFLKEHKKKSIVVALIILVLIGFAIFSNNDNATEEKQASIAGVNIETITASSEVKVPVKFTGRIKSKQSTTVKSLVDGTVQSISAVGTEITTGEPLVLISNSSIEAQYFSALSNFNNAQSSFQETLSTTQSSKNQAQISFNQAEQNLELAKQALSDGKSTAELNFKIAIDTAELAYNQAYQTLDNTMRYLGNPNLYEYKFIGLQNNNQEIYQTALNQFVISKSAFLKLNSVASRGSIESDLDQILIALTEVEKLNNQTVTLLEFAVGNGAFTESDIATAKTQVSSFRTSINASESALVSAKNGISNTKIQNSISISNLEKKLEIAQLQVENAEIALQSQGSSTQIQNLSASSQLNSARSQLALAQRQYNNLRIPAPFSGTVINHKISIGDQISPGQTILELGNLDIIEIELIVSSSLADGLSENQPVSINGLEVGKISEIEPAADLNTGKIGVIVEADNQNGQFVPGSVAEVEFNLVFETDESIVVPLKLVKVSQSTQTVLLVREGKIVEQPVQLGKVFNNYVEITEGLKEGDQIVVEKGGFLQEGDAVKILN